MKLYAPTLLFDVLANDTDADAGDRKTPVSLGLIRSAASRRRPRSWPSSASGNQIGFDPGTAFDCLRAEQAPRVVVGYTMREARARSGRRFRA